MTTASIVETVGVISVSNNSPIRTLSVEGSNVSLHTTQNVAIVQVSQDRVITMMSGIQGPTGASGSGSGNSYNPSGW